MPVFNIPQDPFYDDQDIVFDIDQIYNSFIREIDSFRSYLNATTTKLSSITLDSINNLYSNSDTSTALVQESRCHAFYRLIGLPVVDINGNMYNPGFDRAVNLDKDIFANRLKIANGIPVEIFDLFDKREQFFKDQYSVFSLQDVNAIALTVASKYVRTFNILKDGIDPLSKDTQKTKLRAYLDGDTSIGKIVDVNGNTPIVGFGNNSHIIKPFIVDPRIDFTVTPVKNRISAPFLKNKLDTKIRDDVFLVRPLIEKICRVRLNISNKQSSVGNFVNQIIQSVKAGTALLDSDPTLTAIKTDISLLTKSEAVVSRSLLKIIKATINALYDSIKIIDKTRYAINWLPMPNKNGPEYGVTLNQIIDGDPNNKDIENAIQILTIKKTLSEIDLDTKLSGDLGTFAFSGADDMALSSLKNVPTFYENNISKITKKRDKIGNEANQAVKTIEIIMGEFSGLGLIDILAIYTALWLVDKSVLINLLDDTSFNRMYDNKELRSEEVEARKSGGGVSGLLTLTAFEKKVVEVYKLMDTLFEDKGNNK